MCTAELCTLLLPRSHHMPLVKSTESAHSKQQLRIFTGIPAAWSDPLWHLSQGQELLDVVGQPGTSWQARCGLQQESKTSVPKASPPMVGKGWESPPFFQPGFSQLKGSYYYSCNSDMASPESVVLITCSVPKGFTLCPAKLLAKLFLSLPEHV